MTLCFGLDVDVVGPAVVGPAVIDPAVVGPAVVGPPLVASEGEVVGHVQDEEFDAWVDTIVGRVMMSAGQVLLW